MGAMRYVERNPVRVKMVECNYICWASRVKGGYRSSPTTRRGMEKDRIDPKLSKPGPSPAGIASSKG